MKTTEEIKQFYRSLSLLLSCIAVEGEERGSHINRTGVFVVPFRS